MSYAYTETEANAIVIKAITRSTQAWSVTEAARELVELAPHLPQENYQSADWMRVRVKMASRLKTQVKQGNLTETWKMDDRDRRVLAYEGVKNG